MCQDRRHLHVTRLASLLVLGLLLGGCAAAATPTPTVEPTATPLSTATATAEPPSTATPLPPTPTPQPTSTPTAEPMPSPTEEDKISVLPVPVAVAGPATDTVCATGCDFSTIQAALDALNDESTQDSAIIELLDPVHTEPGIVVKKSVTIRGLGSTETIVQAHESDSGACERVFLIKKGATVTLQGLTIRHGQPAHPDDHGGGIYNYGSLTLQDCVVSHNRANGGGGIANSGTLTLVDSTISGNSAHGDAPLGDECGNGGGIKCGNGTLTVFSSTIGDNQAGPKGRDRGGGVFVGCGCQATLVNSTISGNRAQHSSGRTFGGGQGLGGGAYALGVLQLVHCTISDNRASSQAGGVFVPGTLHYAHTIIANNTGRGDQCIVVESDGTLGINSNNLVEGSGNCAPACTDDPLLGPLEDNGGSTLTHMLLPGSPAIDALAADACALSSDQRSAPRPASVDADPPRCDLGAVEWQP